MTVTLTIVTLTPTTPTTLLPVIYVTFIVILTLLFTRLRCDFNVVVYCLLIPHYEFN